MGPRPVDGRGTARDDVGTRPRGPGYVALGRADAAKVLGASCGQTLQRIRCRYVDWRYGAIDAEASVGKRGEQAAARLLRRKGLVVVAESESDRGGEIDLIAVDRRHKTIIFVEVKTHSTRSRDIRPNESTEPKQGG